MISKKSLASINHSSLADVSYYIYDTDIGKITIASNNEAIISVNFGITEEFGECRPTELISRAAQQLNEYFAGKRRVFDVPIQAMGTPFQKLVWNALMTIPYGETRSYKQIAMMIGKPKACRAVGMANNRNPIAIIIPCHRVIGSDGSLVGYGGGLDIKKQLLSLEKRIMP
ncbi:MAG TPA: methylated-DNA--[protein]-cysteine S-methyltransferase [Clostridiaceae bacterium]|nr:methylated-DNA--[protein]-cysteine S-methyltransferase [Clostridiaceae bacterium]